MRRHFVEVIKLVEDVADEDEVTLGELAERWGEPIGRIIDAIDTIKMILPAERTVSILDWEWHRTHDV